ncbi:MULTISPECIES: HAD family hydrolase [Streptomyces]|uniref:HAD family hydrolase n=1 Tax=Streptomyces flaveolus TaxID=67297 RepID=A0ABV3A6U9_9ACTN|nr:MULTISPECIES: HAD family hydrolase [Streptomyces]
MTSDATSDAPTVASENEKLRELITSARFVLWDFDGPICRLFARHRAEQVAADLVDWLEGHGLRGLLTDTERETPDPHVVLRAVGRRRPGSDLVAELEERLTQEEVRAAASALPTAYADPLIRTWTAVGARLAVTTDNSPLAVRTYLDSRGITGCFTPHVYGRTEDLHHLEPHPHCLTRALHAMGAVPAAALVIGDAVSDLTAARETGVPFLGYAHGETAEKRLRAAGAAHVVRSLEPLLNAVRHHRPYGRP